MILITVLSTQTVLLKRCCIVTDIHVQQALPYYYCVADACMWVPKCMRNIHVQHIVVIIVWRIHACGYPNAWETYIHSTSLLLLCGGYMHVGTPE